MANGCKQNRRQCRPSTADWICTRFTTYSNDDYRYWETPIRARSEPCRYGSAGTRTRARGWLSEEKHTNWRTRIGELAKQCGVKVQTLRFYERRKLLPEPPRRLSGYRDYPAEAVRWVRQIRRGKELGFSLREIKELLGLQRRAWARCADVAAGVEEKL